VRQQLVAGRNLVARKAAVGSLADRVGFEQDDRRAPPDAVGDLAHPSETGIAAGRSSG
jgi:hypothetical protein